MRLQLNLRNNCLARGINLKEEFQTQFLKTNNKSEETPQGVICHLCLPPRTALLLWGWRGPAECRLLLGQGGVLVLNLSLIAKPGNTGDGTLRILKLRTQG